MPLLRWRILRKACGQDLALFGVQMTEANLITPFTMSKVAKVHPFVTLFALFLFGSMFGLLGMLLALLPMVMLLWTLFQVFWVEGAIDTDPRSNRARRRGIIAGETTSLLVTSS